MNATPAVAWHSAGMAEVAAGDDWVEETLATRLAAMPYTKTAVAAVLGLDPTDHDVLRRVVIRNAADGAPEATLGEQAAGVTIAMTDRADWAVCAVTGSDVRVGCDLEIVERRSAAFVADYFTPSEQKLVASGDHELLANLVWSAKESALKVLRTGLRRDTRTVEVTLDEHAGDGWMGLTVDAGEGNHFPGWWARFGEFVLTVATSRPAPPPVSIQRPPALATATPSHTWMRDPLRHG